MPRPYEDLTLKKSEIQTERALVLDNKFKNQTGAVLVPRPYEDLTLKKSEIQTERALVLDNKFRNQTGAVLVRGIILKKIPYGEADEILTVLFQTQGVRKVFIAGSRKSQKRYPGLADHFSHLEFSLKTPPHGLWRAFGLALVPATDRPALSDLRVYGFLGFLAEMICEFVPEGEDEESLYSLWLDLSGHFQAQGFLIELVLSALLKLLKQTGYALSWGHCVSCQDLLLPNLACGFDERHGGFLCEKCDFNHGVKFKREYLQAFESDSRRVFDNNDAAVFVCRLVAFTQNILQKRIKSADFFLNTMEECYGK